MTRQDWFQLTLLGAIWGASFLFIRIAAPSFGAFALVATRVLLAAFVLIVFALITRQPFIAQLRERWLGFLFLGIFNSALPFTLITGAELTLTAQMAAILNASTPFFAALTGALWFRDRLTRKKIGGLALGLFGVTLVVGLSPVPLETGVIIAVFMVLGASLGYGFSSNVTKAYFKNVSPLALSIGQNLFAGLVLLPLAILNPPQGEIPANALFSVLALAIVSTSIAYLISFSLIKRVSATSMTTVTMLVPFFSVLWTAIFLHTDEVGLGQIVGLIVIVVSITLITNSRLPFLDRLIGRRREAEATTA